MVKDMRLSGGAIALSLLCFTVAGCQPSAENRLLNESGLTMEDPKYYPSDDNVRMGKVYFRNGDFGLAEEKFRKAVEVTPKDAEAWLGLAASYDQLRRFDLADKAYAQTLKLASNNAIILNNAGYSLLLRGDNAGARRMFLRALELDPDNPYIKHNIELLGESKTAVKRV